MTTPTPTPLSPREAEVVSLRLEGLLLKQIAHRLGLSVPRVHACLRRARAKGAQVPGRPIWKAALR